jgi:hypothetical protein
MFWETFTIFALSLMGARAEVGYNETDDSKPSPPMLLKSKADIQLYHYPLPDLISSKPGIPY